MNKWSVQVNDLTGGWIVTTYPQPLSQHHLYDKSKRGYIIAECVFEEDAQRIARLLNQDEAAK